MRWVAPMTTIANDRALAALVAADPTAGATTMPVGWLRTYLGSAPAVEPEDFDACPVVLAHPAADAWTPLELSLRFLHRLPSRQQHVVLLERAGHFPVEQPGLDQLADVLSDRLTAAGIRVR